MTDFVIMGQGNPGREHAEQRHNLGFWVVNRLAKRHGISMHSGRVADTGHGRIDEADVVLVKPKTYYNGTGQAIAPILKRERVPMEKLIVVYDDLDLGQGRLRLRPKGSDGGNNGLKSIIAATGSREFGRIRVGVGRPKAQGVPTWDQDYVIRWLLSRPPKESREILDEAVERACDAVETVIKDGWDRAMDVYNRES
ncbi:MAG TPA: aminoacyl-tRNA hydrolase [Dehalococcoidia bacterium]|nr:aminoacyl-tRNA hydrolase [Dehalococcoidia bacterium]